MSKQKPEFNDNFRSIKLLLDFLQLLKKFHKNRILWEKTGQISVIIDRTFNYGKRLAYNKTEFLYLNLIFITINFMFNLVLHYIKMFLPALPVLN